MCFKCKNMSKKGKTGPENYVQNIGERKVGEGIRKMVAFILNLIIRDMPYILCDMKNNWGLYTISIGPVIV